MHLNLNSVDASDPAAAQKGCGASGGNGCHSVNRGASDVNSDGSDICQPGARERPDCAFHKALLCRAGRATTNVSAVHLEFLTPTPSTPPLMKFFGGCRSCTTHNANKRACACSKKVEFSVMPPSDIIKNGVFQPFDARLYQVPIWLSAMLLTCEPCNRHAEQADTNGVTPFSSPAGPRHPTAFWTPAWCASSGLCGCLSFLMQPYVICAAG